nr:hypothetical protein [uncultured Glaciecola sp.]
MRKDNLLLAIALSVIFMGGIFVIFRFSIEFDNSKNNIVVASTQLADYQQFITKPANKRQLIATLQSIRMHNVTRYQRLSRPNEQLNQNDKQQSLWPYFVPPNVNVSKSLDLKMAKLHPRNKMANAWNSVDDSHSKGSEPVKILNAALQPVQHGW